MKNFIKKIKEFFIKRFAIFKFDREKFEKIYLFLFPNIGQITKNHLYFFGL